MYQQRHNLLKHGYADVSATDIRYTTSRHHENMPIYCFPLKPYFYIVKLEFIGVCIIFLISAQKHRLLYSLEPPRIGDSNEYPQCMSRGGSNRYPQSMFLSRNMKNIRFENFHFWW